MAPNVRGLPKLRSERRGKIASGSELTTQANEAICVSKLNKIILNLFHEDIYYTRLHMPLLHYRKALLPENRSPILFVLACIRTNKM